jgi:BASS family bile acid:Na+ symporter
MIGESRIESARPQFKLINYLVLLLLNYVNGAVALPQAVAYPDWDFLAVILAATITLCVTAFSAGWWLGRLFGANRPRCIALMFGLGMSNNGSGLVLAGIALAGHPEAMVPILVYNLVQHLVAGGAASLVARPGVTTAQEEVQNPVKPAAGPVEDAPVRPHKAAIRWLPNAPRERKPTP